MEQSNSLSTKVSIIVPVYNVGEYLYVCIDSIISQSNKDWELILVDDGSTDGSDDICDNYSEHDGRIKVLHKANSGSSDSRNLGIDNATGDYLMFVDSDDNLYPDAVDIMLGVATRTHADIVVSAYQVSSGTPVFKLEKMQESLVTHFDTNSALKELMYQKRITNSPWAKLYRRETFGAIRYPSGKINQDLGTTYKVFAKATSIVYVDMQLYVYMQRPGSIINSNFSLKRMAGLEFAKEELVFIKKNFPACIKAAENRLFSEAVSIFLKINESQDRQDYADEMNELWSIIVHYRSAVFFDSKSRLKTRASGVISLLGKAMFVWTGTFMKKKVEGKL